MRKIKIYNSNLNSLDTYTPRRGKRSDLAIYPGIINALIYVTDEKILGITGTHQDIISETKVEDLTEQTIPTEHILYRYDDGKLLFYSSTKKQYYYAFTFMGNKPYIITIPND